VLTGHSQSPETPRLGSVFGRYRLDALVGQGGMGVVFRATDLDLQRPVALKFLSPALADDPVFRERFVRESRVAAAIEHPSIVPIYEAGMIGSSPFIAMRFVPGRDLRTILRIEAPFTAGRTIALARQLGSALDAAHRQGVVHRDVKPGNVILESDGEERAYLVDFGLTRRLGEVSASSRSGAVGSIDYIAPEQIESREVDGRADQYALACLVVHCLTGRPPFDLDSDAAVLHAHLHAAPPDLAEVRPELPAAAAAAVTRAMSKAATDRYADCRGFVTALTGEAEPAYVASAAESLPRAATAGGRRRSILVLGAVGLLVSMGLLAATAVVLAPGPPGGETDPSSLPASETSAQGAATDLWEAEVIVFSSDRDGDYDLYAIEAGMDRPSRLTNTARDERSPAISPDGRTIAYVVGTEPERDIWLMDADGSDRRGLITGSADDIDPAWSSDGRRLAYASGVPAYGATPSPNSYDIFEVRFRGPGLDDPVVRNVTARPAVESYPSWRPGTRQLAIASNYSGGNREIIVIDADDSSSQRRLTNDFAYNLNPDWSPDGKTIVYVRRPFDPSAVAQRGIPDIQLVEARGGNPRALTRTPRIHEQDPEWSPDGRAIAYAAGPEGSLELWIMTTGGERNRLLGPGWTNAVEPAWGVIAPASQVSAPVASPSPA
jgi:Tol biopolymer transport system component